MLEPGVVAGAAQSRLDAREVLVPARGMDDPCDERDRFRYLVLGPSVSTHPVLHGVDALLGRAHAGSGHGDYERHVSRHRGGQRDDPPTLAMAVEPDSRRTDVVAALQEVERGQCLRGAVAERLTPPVTRRDRKSTRLNSSHITISYAVFCLK